MKPLSDISESQASRLRFVLTDIDDTLTEEGRLPDYAYSALWDLYRQGIHVIPVTGRPAGWCDLIAREWPVVGVVGENGAFVFFQDETGRMKRLYHPETDAKTISHKLHLLRIKVLNEVEEARIASDQFGRMFDLAIDFAEEPPVYGLEVAERIKETCESTGAIAKISSIHVNAWYGNYNKLGMSRLFLEKQFGIPMDSLYDEVLFCGDSPNDEPMFEFFPFSCAVGNFSAYISSVESFPSYISDQRGGKGFKDIITTILEKRSSLL